MSGVEGDFVPVDDLARDGQERMLRFPDGEHWGWWSKTHGRWLYRPFVGPEYKEHPGEPSAYRRRKWDCILLPLERRPP